MAGGVLVADDLTDRSEVVVAAGHDLASRLGLPWSVLHVLSDKALESRRQGVPDEAAFLDVIFDQIRAEVREKLRDGLGAEVASETPVHVVHGEPDESILEVLEHEIVDFAVLGVRRRTRVGKLVFGSTAQSVLLLSPCPVVAVPVGD
jgi:nucleotide-binding universal stress UspA family protein